MRAFPAMENMDKARVLKHLRTEPSDLFLTACGVGFYLLGHAGATVTGPKPEAVSRGARDVGARD